MQTHIIQETGHELLFVEVPEDARKFVIERQPFSKNKGLFYMVKVQHSIELPQGDWQLLGLTDQIKETDLEGVMPTTKHYTWGGYGYAKTEDVYYDYQNIGLFIKRKATESLTSLMEFLKLPNQPHVLLIRKI